MQFFLLYNIPRQVSYGRQTTQVNKSMTSFNIYFFCLLNLIKQG